MESYLPRLHPELSSVSVLAPVGCERSGAVPVLMYTMLGFHAAIFAPNSSADDCVSSSTYTRTVEIGSGSMRAHV